MSTIKRIIALAAVLAWTGTAFGQPTELNLGANGSGTVQTYEGVAFVEGTPPGASGTGLFDPFYRVKGGSILEGVNTGNPTVQFDTEKGKWTTELLLSTVTQFTDVSNDIGLGAGKKYREFFLDINQSGSSGTYDIVDIQMYIDDQPDLNCLNPAPETPGYGACDTGDPADRIFWLNEIQADRPVYVRLPNSTGSGKADMTFLVPEEWFPAGCDYGSPTCDTYVYLYSKFDGNSGGFEEWSTAVQAFVVVEKTIDGAYDQVITWDIDKDVDPEAWDLFKGDKATSTYTVTVTKGSEDKNPTISGIITLKVPSETTGGKNAPDAIVTDLEDEFCYEDPITLVVECVAITPICGALTFPFTIKAGNFVECTYSSSVPMVVGGLNTATAYVEDASGIIRDFEGTADLLEGGFDPVPQGDATVSVEDNFDGGGYVALGTADANKTFTYDRDFVCGTSKTYNNTAQIVGSDETASAAVAVTCRDLGVVKDATTYLKRKWSWDIDKKAYKKDLDDKLVEITDKVNLSVGSDVDVYYKITVGTTGYVDSDWVDGKITITNPHPTRVAKITGVADIVSPAIAATVDCGVTFPYDIAANGGSLECDYEADLPDGADRTNTATATLQNYWFNKVVDDGPPIDRDDLMDGTTDFSGNAAVSFASAIMTEVDDCVDVTDDYGTPLDLTDDIDLGEVCYDDVPMPAVLEYMRNFGAGEEDCKEFDPVVNTATYLAGSGATDSDDATVIINVPCAGCTYTQGYWKTHNMSFWGGASKKADPAWCLIGDVDEDEVKPEPMCEAPNDDSEREQEDFFESGMTYFEVMWTPPAGGNAYYSLAHQWIAAWLNVLNGAALPTEVAGAWTAGAAMLQSCEPDWTDLKDECMKSDFNMYASILDDYNNGLMGVPHCDDEEAVEEDGGETAVKADKDKKVGPGANSSESDETEATFTPATVGTPAVTADSEGRAVSEVPNAFGIANYPNPFNPQTTISIAVPELSHVSVAIFDLMGRFVAQLVDGSMPAGTHTITWSAEQLPSGTYFLMMRAGEFAQTRQMTLLK